jgi:hypothetical protein
VGLEQQSSRVNILNLKHYAPFLQYHSTFLRFTHSQHYLMAHLNVPPIQCNEILIGAGDNKVRAAVMDEVN